ncbi:ATP-dependent endonuclease [Candidatus Saccharibacteria bacterium]|nr:MAG: ATP-dependent endonuclease [Candidatus Saccharibacteria bacterium]
MRQTQALQLMMDGESIFLTGAPGAGKTHVLNEFIRLARKRGKNVAITASTGIAATHIGGSTIHSWSGLGILDTLSQHDLARLSAKSKLVKRYNATDILVIDEISMLHGRRLDMVNLLAKKIRMNNKPFGGLQVVLVGDLFQLPPVERERTEPDFAHLSAAWEELDPVICYLTEQHRQMAGDTLLDLLGAMRQGDVGEYHEAALQERLAQKPAATTVLTRLYAHNVDVDKINEQHLRALGAEPKTYRMRASGAAAKREQLMKSVLAPEELILKRGAEVMFVANSQRGKFVNGTRGVVMDFVGDTPLVVTTGGKEVHVEPHSWSLEEDGRVTAEVTQLPLRLAWAITIHKSQGMSLDAAEIDLSRSFAPGMGYVALSRVRSMDGIYLTGVNRMALAMHPAVHEFDKWLHKQSELRAQETLDFAEKTASEDIEAALDEALFRELKAWRTRQAAAEKTAPYMVFHDTTLKELAARRPQTEQALLAVKGVGTAKWRRYGEDILRIMKW